MKRFVTLLMCLVLPFVMGASKGWDNNASYGVWEDGGLRYYGYALNNQYVVNPNAIITDHGDVSSNGSMAYLVNEIGADERTLRLPGADQNYQLKQSLTIPANITLQQDPGAVIQTHYSVAGGGSAWTIHAGSVYKKDAAISEPSFLWDLTTGSPVALTEVAGAADINAAGKWAWEGGYLYVRTTGSVDPDTLGADILRVGYVLTIGKDGVHGITQRFDSYPGEITLSTSVYSEWFSSFAYALHCAAACNIDLFISSDISLTESVLVTASNYLGIICKNNSTITSTVVDDGTYDSAIYIDGNANTRLILDGIKISHTYTAGSTLYGLYVNNEVASISGKNIVIEGFPYYNMVVSSQQQTWTNCQFLTSKYAGAYFGGSGAINIVGCEASSNGPGANTAGYGMIFSGGNVKITGGKYISNDRYGIDIRRADNAVIEGAYVYNSGLTGIYGVNEDAEKDVKNIKITNCTINMNSRVGSTNGIWVGSYGGDTTTSVGEVVISQCTIANALQHGILVGGGTVAAHCPQRVVISENTINASGNEVGSYRGIYIAANVADGMEMVVVTTNELKASNCIQLVNCKYPEIVDNIINTTASIEYGIALSGETFGTIRGNTLLGTFTTPISGTTVFTENNTVNTVDYHRPRSRVSSVSIPTYNPMLSELFSYQNTVVDEAVTGIIRITVPNTECAGRIVVEYDVFDADKADNHTSGIFFVSLVRYPGATTVASAVVDIVPATNVSTGSGWGRTTTVTWAVAAPSGAVGETQTIDLTLTADTEVVDDAAKVNFFARLITSGKTMPGSTGEMTIAGL